jgi:hypothetical protein
LPYRIFRTRITLRHILFILAAAAFLGLPARSAFAAADEPCAKNSEARQLDYWLGDWTINSPGEGPSATSKVTLELNQCLVVESWQDEKDHRGKNMFAYAAREKSWRGMFVDNDGRAHIFDHGTVASGSAEFFGPSRGPNGEALLNRIRVVRLAGGKVEQSWDKSTDNGATWVNQFRLEYSPKSNVHTPN